MTRTELQQALKSLREQGLTDIKLNVKTEELQAEFDLVGSCQIGFTPIAEPELTVTEVPEQNDETLEIATYPLIDTEQINPLTKELQTRHEGAADEARMQDAIDRAGLYEELETAWYSIPGYKDFEPIFKGDAAMGIFAELLMTEAEHANYVRVCKEAQRIQEEFSRRALEKVLSQ